MIMSDINDYFRLILYWKHFRPVQAHLILEKTGGVSAAYTHIKST